MTDDTLAHYGQFLDRHQGFAQAACVTYAQGVDEDAFIRAFGGDPADTASRSLRELDAELAPYHYNQIPCALLVTRVGDWLVGIEENGFQGSRPEVLRGASAGGAAVSVYWNVNGTNRFAYHVAGRRAVGFDMYHPEERWGGDPDALLDDMADLTFDAPWASGLVLAERVSGVRLDDATLAGVFRRVFLTPVPEDLVPEGVEDRAALDDPFVRSVLAEPTVERLPEITRFLAHLVARDTGVQEDPLARAALAVLDARAHGRTVAVDGLLAQRLTTRADDLLAESRRERDRNAFRRMHAMLGLRDALHDDLAEAAFRIYWSGGYALGDADASLVNSVLGRCRDRALRDAAKRGAGR
ncbi:DUF6461 domain-containing protein [Micromonospora sp. NPDC049836]|uniref:DUF6461 domain-containing protein n=1 Tax=Micromonospora sp. NPDC049836 TaxID=3364274 RepID=UPI0037987C01